MPSLANAFARLERADEHLREVRRLAQDICTAQATATRVQVSPGKTIQPGELAHVFSVESANTPIAGRLSVLVGDAVNSMRSCLDYLVAELAEMDSGPGNRRTQFPIEQSPETFKARRETFLNGVNDVHATYIESLQPFCGTQWTARLARMSNWDKHNKLVLVVHDYLVGGTMTLGKPVLSGELPAQFQFTLMPSLVVQLDDGLRVIDTLDEIRGGVGGVLDHFAPELSQA